ncbi:MAG TPA: Rieske 2Fe-2S domain-containing protein [Frankiaceae bacterium]|nr:Rieske 2Fe-2S domain-containing protein [Frankiaceae bacterium]
MGSKYRYPFPPNPDGWYFLAQSAALGAGDVLPLHYFGRDLVLYRTDGGRAVLVDAHCPHMGAHLGYGGKTDGEGIRCPFHHWCFNADGQCVEVPYAAVPGRPPKVALSTWLVREHSGLIMTWCSDTGQAPTWDPPLRPEFGSEGWIGYETAGWTIRMHTQELAENIPDTAHFTYIHEVGPQMRAEYEITEHVYRQRSLVVIDGVATEFTTQEASGLGLVWLHTQSGMWFLTATTPIDDEYVELRLLFLVPDPIGDGVVSDHAQAMIDATVENTSRDVPIWEHKVYVERAPLVSDDGPIRALRTWARQFYPEPAGSP